MEENRQEGTSSPENEGATTINQAATKKVVAPRKPVLRKQAIEENNETDTVTTELEANSIMLPEDLIVEIESITYQNSEKLDKKNLKKLKKMKDKVKEKEKKAKEKQKEKEKKAKKKKKDKAKKENAKKKLKEKKAKKKAASRKKKSKK